jgi:uncharacterized BrkB/YihY/UPF0761 family membrane protein
MTEELPRRIRLLSPLRLAVRDFQSRASALPPVRKGTAILAVYHLVLGDLLAAGLAFGALFAGLAGLLCAVGVLGYIISDGAARTRLVDQFVGDLAPLAPVARDGLAIVASHSGAISLAGLAGLAWTASGFYGSLDVAIGRIFIAAPARGIAQRILRGLTCVLVLVVGLLSGIVSAAAQAAVEDAIPGGASGDAARVVSAIVFPLSATVVAILIVGIVYRTVPNVHVPIAVLRLPAVVVGLILAGLAELFVVIAPRLVGSLSLFGGFAAVFAALVWLSLAFRALLMGAVWTRLRLDEAGLAPSLVPEQGFEP